MIQYALIVRDHIGVAVGLSLHCRQVKLVSIDSIELSDPDLTQNLAYLIESLISLADI